MPVHSPSDSIVLYSLTSGSTSEFKNLRICEHRCPGGEDLKHVAVSEHDTDPDELLKMDLEGRELKSV